LGIRSKRTDVAVWDRFWAGKQVQEIYPPVTDITSEVAPFFSFLSRKVLEVGAGTGRDGLKMRERGAQVFLLDYSAESLRLARQVMTRDEVGLIMADGLRSPFPDRTFDLIFHQGLLEHFRSPHELIRENHRILKKDGLVVVDVPQTVHIYTVLKQLLQMAGLWFAGWERQFTVGSLTRLLRQHGFEPVGAYGDWSRPGILYRIFRQAAAKAGMKLPMYPRFLGRLTAAFYRLQKRLNKKRLLQYTTLSIGVIARKI